MIPQTAFWLVCGLPRGADYILSTIRTNTSMNRLTQREYWTTNATDVLKIKTSAVLAVSAAQLLKLAWKCLKLISRYGTIKGTLVPQLFDSGQRFLVSVIRNDASLKYSSHGHIRFSSMSVNRYFWPIMDIFEARVLSPLAREGRSGFFSFCYNLS